MRESKALAALCVVAAMVCWGSIPVFLRSFRRDLDPWTVNGVRYSLGALFWLPYLLLNLRRAPRAGGGPRRSVWVAALVPTIPNVIGQVGYGVSPYFVPASTIGFAMRLSFLFTVLFGFLFVAQERWLARRGAFWWGAAVSMAGVVLMFVGKLRDGGEGSTAGLVIVVATTVAWGAYAVAVRKCMAPYPVRQSFGVISLYSAALLLVLMALFGRWGALGRQSAALWGRLAASAVIGVAIGHVLYQHGIQRLGPIVASGILLGTPLITYLGAALILGERMTPVQSLGGAAIVLGGVLLVTAKARTATAHASPIESSDRCIG